VAAPTLEILQEVWVAPKAVLCVQEHWAKGWKRKAPSMAFGVAMGFGK